MSFRRILKWTGIVFGAVAAIGIIAVIAIWWLLRASLAQLDGHSTLPGLGAKVLITRDGLGVPTIYATNRLDATRALGFLHAQDRFFQMDLSRRAGAGELSELFGPAVLGQDQRQRVHRPRARAKRAFEQAAPNESALLRAYAEGVNAGLETLGARPPEYLLLRAAPARWQPEDTYLVSFAMFETLHDIGGYNDYGESVLRAALSPAALAFFNCPDIDWSAALDGSTLSAPPIPSPEDFPLTNRPSQAKLLHQPTPGSAQDAPTTADPEMTSEDGLIGSNNWAVDGRHSGTGSALVANDMHLALTVPNTWYRARLIYSDQNQAMQDVIGATLPGAPVVVSGSNGKLAWGNTASDLDTSDLVSMEVDPANQHRYRTPSGWQEFQRFTETIQVRNGKPVEVAVEETIWGPVVMRGETKFALACTVHEPGSFNLGLIAIEQAPDTDTALRLSGLAGTPVLNFVVGDRAGNIGYSLLGRLPNRVGFDGSSPTSWANGTRAWQGWVPAEDYPRVINPTNGILWTANNRTMGSPAYHRLHISSPDNGARARQIRDDLLAMEKPTEKTLWSIYRDDRALFLDRWQKLLLKVLENGPTDDPAWPEAKGLVAGWGARAAVDSQGYRLVRGFRAYALDLLFEPVNRRLSSFDKGMRIANEEAAWRLISERPLHLLNPDFPTYDKLLEHAVDLLLSDLKRRGIPLAQATWGNRNHLDIRHPISQAVPQLSRWLDMPDAQVSGDSQMPKVHAGGFGVSERMIVSPGHEENGLFNMPGGQSGHFLSPFYRSEMESWLRIEPHPLLPGPRAHALELRPGN